MDGSSARYTYDATGRKLRAEYLKAGNHLQQYWSMNLIMPWIMPRIIKYMMKEEIKKTNNMTTKKKGES